MTDEKNPKIYATELSDLFFFKTDDGTTLVKGTLLIIFKTLSKPGQTLPNIKIELAVAVDPEVSMRNAENKLLKQASKLLKIASLSEKAMIEIHQETREFRAQNRHNYYF